MRVSFVALAVAAFVAGCGAGEGGGGADVFLDPQAGCDDGRGVLEVPAEVAPGDEVPLSVDNVTEDATLTFGLSGRVERASGERWVEAADAAVPRPVPEIAVVVEPGESSRTGGGATADVIELTTDAEPGAYRVLKDVTATERGSGGANRATLCAGFAVSD